MGIMLKASVRSRGLSNGPWQEMIMQILYLNPIATFYLDVIVWILLDLGIAYCCSKFPIERFDFNSRFYQSLAWEKDGKIYQELFHVRSWKRYIPQGSKLFHGFSLQNLPSMDLAYLRLWLQESCRGEFCHWMMIWPSIFFFLWNSTLGGWLMVAYALLVNFFPIVEQRFNRPRVRHYLEQTNQVARPVLIPNTVLKPAYNTNEMVKHAA